MTHSGGDWREIVDGELLHAVSLLESLGYSTDDSSLLELMEEDYVGPLIYGLALFVALARSIVRSAEKDDVDRALDCMRTSRLVKTTIGILGGDSDLSFSEAFKVQRSKEFASTAARDRKSTKLAVAFFQKEHSHEAPSRDNADAALKHWLNWVFVRRIGISILQFQDTLSYIDRVAQSLQELVLHPPKGKDRLSRAVLDFLTCFKALATLQYKPCQTLPLLNSLRRFQ